MKVVCLASFKVPFRSCNRSLIRSSSAAAMCVDLYVYLCSSLCGVYLIAVTARCVFLLTGTMKYPGALFYCRSSGNGSSYSAQLVTQQVLYFTTDITRHQHAEHPWIGTRFSCRTCLIVVVFSHSKPAAPRSLFCVLLSRQTYVQKHISQLVVFSDFVRVSVGHLHYHARHAVKTDRSYQKRKPVSLQMSVLIARYLLGLQFITSFFFLPYSNLFLPNRG